MLHRFARAFAGIIVSLCFIGNAVVCFSSPLPEKTLIAPEDCKARPVAAGPEDFALDPRPGANRLLVSMEDRRRSDGESRGALGAVDLQTGEYRELERSGDEFIQPFRPHGVDAIRTEDGRFLLYVILHGPGQGEYLWNRIAVYSIEENRLVYEHGVEDGRIESPNDIAATPDGGFYVGNDALDSFWSTMLSLENRTVIRCDPDGECKVAAFGLAFPNGLAFDAKRGRMYVAETRGHRVMSFEVDEEGILREPEELFEARGADNLFLDGDHLYVAAHNDDLAFLAHRDDLREASPSVIWRYNLVNGRRTAVYASPGVPRKDLEAGAEEGAAPVDGSDGHISAASGAVPVGSSLWIAQVFGDYLLECDLPKE